MTEAEKIQQIKTEYEEGRSFLENRKLRWVDQLILMNNLQRGDENIASTMLFSYFMRVHSNLYEPKLQIKFGPNEDTETKNVQMLNKLALSDFQEMGMDMIEYDWTWDACFFSRGYLETLKFDKEKKTMVPVVLNPLAFIYDPFFPEPQDWRYYAKWITRSGSTIDDLIADKVIKGISSCKDIVSGMDPEFWNYKVLREKAKDVTPQGPDSSTPPSNNGVYQLLEHCTYFGGVKTVCWCDRDITKIIREEPLDLNDGEEIKNSRSKTKKRRSKWPIVVREVFREPHSSAAVSVPDLLEDKHRAENVILNLAYIASKDEATPIYVAKEGALTNPTQLLQRQIMQHIIVTDEADTSTAIVPLNKSPGLSASTLQFLNIMKGEAAEAIGTTQISPIVSKGKKSATGDAIQQQIADLTASLQTKIIGKSEKEFWSHWYQRYINNMKEGDEKIIATTNSQFTTFETIHLDDIKTKNPPKAIVYSVRDAEFKEAVERREIAQQFGVIQGSLPPERFSAFLKYIWFPKFQTFDSETIDLIYPKSVDEIKAEQENIMLGEGKLPPISETDNHEIHLYMHSRVKNNAEKWAHVLTHEALLSKQMQAKMQEQQAEQSKGGDKKPSSKDVNKDEAATPLKGQSEKVVKGFTSNIKK